MKHFFQRHFNNRDAILNSRVGRWLGTHIHHPELWHFGRRAVAGGVGVGFFVAFVPLPMHMLIAIPIAIWLRVNLPVAVGSVWIVNPLTIAPFFLFALRVGMIVTGHEHDYEQLQFDHTVHGLKVLFSHLWAPLVIGCLLCGASAGALGNFAVRAVWRYYLVRRRRQRRHAAHPPRPVPGP